MHPVRGRRLPGGSDQNRVMVPSFFRVIDMKAMLLKPWMRIRPLWNPPSSPTPYPPKTKSWWKYPPAVFATPKGFAYPIPDTLADAEAAPLLCAGAIGYRSIRLSGMDRRHRGAFSRKMRCDHRYDARVEGWSSMPSGRRTTTRPG